MIGVVVDVRRSDGRPGVEVADDGDNLALVTEPGRDLDRELAFHLVVPSIEFEGAAPDPAAPIDLLDGKDRSAVGALPDGNAERGRETELDGVVPIRGAGTGDDGTDEYDDCPGARSDHRRCSLRRVEGGWFQGTPRVRWIQGFHRPGRSRPGPVPAGHSLPHASCLALQSPEPVGRTASLLEEPHEAVHCPVRSP